MTHHAHWRDVSPGHFASNIYRYRSSAPRPTFRAHAGCQLLVQSREVIPTSLARWTVQIPSISNGIWQRQTTSLQNKRMQNKRMQNKRMQNKRMQNKRSIVRRCHNLGLTAYTASGYIIELLCNYIVYMV